MDKQTLIDVLAYDKFNNAGLSVWDRIEIHQHIYQQISLSSRLKEKIKSIIGMISYYKWQKPEYRYNAAREIEVQDPITKDWKVFQQINNN
ncbi:hypothetical protein [Pseudotenacibaculum haliotis]|uniref:Uncharacterized protein n=1 Tax=Pseudotenacibaculum haliotis TaxID=1862138 RepID=A0ABW5LMM4_9FLAO